MNVIKDGSRYKIGLPKFLMDVLRWHVSTQLVTDEQEASDLLFPSIDGGYRAVGVLNKPFRVVAEKVGLSYRFTQRGLRRTFQDLARHAKIPDIVTRSISGHATEAMQEHYSTVSTAEKAAAIEHMGTSVGVGPDLLAATVPTAPATGGSAATAAPARRPGNGGALRQAPARW
jgi:hypothetical protein